jgi:hypothetical protein
MICNSMTERICQNLKYNAVLSWWLEQNIYFLWRLNRLKNMFFHWLLEPWTSACFVTGLSFHIKKKKRGLSSFPTTENKQCWCVQFYHNFPKLILYWNKILLTKIQTKLTHIMSIYKWNITACLTTLFYVLKIYKLHHKGIQWTCFLYISTQSMRYLMH